MKVFRGLPNRIKVGGLEWNVKVLDKVDDGKTWGECDSATLEFRFEGTHLGNPALALDTVLHEINHAIWECFHLEDGDKEERVSAVFATAWRQVMWANPALVSWMVANLKST